MLENKSDRRRFLKATGVTLALPMLESIPALGAASGGAKAKRLVCVGGYLGFHQEAIYPKETGRGYTMSQTLQPLAGHRDDFTIFSGLDHRAKHGHGEWANYLCGQKVCKVSLDQIVARALGQSTRFESIQLTAGQASRHMSYNHDGVLPMIQRPSVFYNKLFASAADRAHRSTCSSGRSSLDLVRDEAKRLQAGYPPATAIS